MQVGLLLCDMQIPFVFIALIVRVLLGYQRAEGGTTEAENQVKPFKIQKFMLPVKN